MKSLLKFAIVCLFVVGMAAGDAWAQAGNPVPQELNVQGVLRNVAGEVVTGAYGMTFRLYDAPSGGNLLVSKTGTVSVVGGVFNAYLAVTADKFIDKSQVYLEIQIGTDILPRRSITSVGFAFQAEHAEQADELLGAATDLACSNPAGCVDLTDLAVNYAGSSSKGGPADDLVCNGCVASTDIADLTIVGATNQTGVGDIAGSTIGTWNLYNGAVTTDKLANGAVDSNKLGTNAVQTGHIQNNAVNSAKIANGTVGNDDVAFNYALGASKGGEALGLACGAPFSSQCVSSGEVDFNYAASGSKGGPASDVECPNFGGAGIGCVGTGDVGFNFAGSGSKGGAANDLQCTGCVVDGELHSSVHYAAGTTKGGAAVDVQCSGCVGDGDLGINYAASASQGGPATGLSCTDCIGNTELGVNYAGSASQGGPANDLNCPGGCVDTADINNLQVTNAKVASGISGSKISKASSTALGVAKFGNGLTVDGNALVTVDYSQVAAAGHDHGNLYFKKGTEDLYLNPGYKFTFNDGSDSDTAYFRNHTGGSDNQIAMQLVLGDDFDQSERFEIFYTGAAHPDIVVHSLFANGDAFHEGNLQFNGELTCKSGGCIDAADLKANSVTSSEIANGTIAGGDLASNISFTTSGSITADIVTANRFVDRGNTSYWVDPAGTQAASNSWSRLNEVRVNKLYTDALGSGTNYGITGNNLYMDTLNTGVGGDPLEIQYSRCGDVRMFWGSCGNQYLDVNGYMRVKKIWDKNNGGYYLDPNSGSQVSTIYANNWFRAQGTSGFYFESYGGGWNMQDSTWIRAYNNKAVLANGEIRSYSNMRAPIFYDLNDGAYYVDPNNYSHIARTVYQDYPANAAHNVIGDFNPVLGGSAKGISQYQYNYIYPGRVNGGGWNLSYYLGAHSSYGLYSNTGFYASGSVWGNRFYDRNNEACYWDGNSGSGSRTGRLGVADLTVSSHMYAKYGEVTNMRVYGGSFYVGSSWQDTGHVIPHSNGGYYNGYPWSDQWRGWAGVLLSSGWASSSEKFKKDIRDFDDTGYESVMNKVRQIRSVNYYLKEETPDLEEATRLAREDVERKIVEKRQDLSSRFSADQVEAQIRETFSGKEREKVDEMAFNRRYRPVPHIGVIAESLPDELSVFGRDKRGYSLTDMDGILMAGIKALDRKNQQFEQRIVDLDDRIALLEQILVDEGILR